MRNLLICSFLGAALLYAILHVPGKEKRWVAVHFPGNPGLVLNPLDAILGEKRLDDGTFRKANFDSILRIRASFLKDSSELYTVREITENVFLLTRKKFYYDNRCYSLLVKTSGDSIFAFHVISDFPVKGAVYADEKIYTISDDYDEIPSPWHATYTVKVTCYDLHFREQWVTASLPNKGYFFYGTSLERKEHNLLAGIVVQSEGSSTMCTTSYRVKLAMSGELLPEKTEYIDGYGCGPELRRDEVPLLFRHEKTPIR